MGLRYVAPLGALLMLGTLTASIQAVFQQDSSVGAVTFNKQVLPILQKNCQACHRPGEIAPMSFLTYQNVRPWAKSRPQSRSARCRHGLPIPRTVISRTTSG